jgi:hypothetical protein
MDTIKLTKSRELKVNDHWAKKAATSKHITVK